MWLRWSQSHILLAWYMYRTRLSWFHTYMYTVQINTLGAYTSQNSYGKCVGSCNPIDGSLWISCLQWRRCSTRLLHTAPFHSQIQPNWDGIATPNPLLSSAKCGEKTANHNIYGTCTWYGEITNLLRVFLSYLWKQLFHAGHTHQEILCLICQR